MDEAVEAVFPSTGTTSAMNTSNLRAVFEAELKALRSLPADLFTADDDFARFEQSRSISDLNEYISKLEHSSQKLSQRDPIYAYTLSHLGYALLERYRTDQNPDSLRKAHGLSSEALSIATDNDIHRATVLQHAAIISRARYDSTGTLKDLDEAISWLTQAVSLLDNSREEKCLCLLDLGSALHHRSQRLYSLDDLDNGVAFFQEALALTPRASANRFMGLTNLSVCLQDRYKLLARPDDLNEAISLSQSAVDLAPDGHTSLPLCSLGSALQMRYQEQGDQADLARATCLLRKALATLACDDKRRLICMGTLARALNIHFELSGNVKVLDEAISTTRGALLLLPKDHPQRSEFLTNLGHMLSKRFDCLQEQVDHDLALASFKDAATASTGALSARLEACCFCAAASVQEGDHASTVDAVKTLLSLLTQYIWIGGSVYHRLGHLRTLQHMSTLCAAAAIELNELPMAVEWLEETRSFVWRQVLQLRTPLDNLRGINVELASKLEALSRDLQTLSTVESPANGITSAKMYLGASLEFEAQARRRLAEEWEETVQQCRSLAGFEGFLRPLTFDSLSRASQQGIIVVINVFEDRCTALVVPAQSKRVISVPLPRTSHANITVLRNQMNTSLRNLHLRSQDRASRHVTPANLERVLEALWADIVQPVIESLALPDPTVSE